MSTARLRSPCCGVFGATAALVVGRQSAQAQPFKVRVRVSHGLQVPCCPVVLGGVAIGLVHSCYCCWFCSIPAVRPLWHCAVLLYPRSCMSAVRLHSLCCPAAASAVGLCMCSAQLQHLLLGGGVSLSVFDGLEVRCLLWSVVLPGGHSCYCCWYPVHATMRPVRHLSVLLRQSCMFAIRGCFHPVVQCRSLFSAHVYTHF
jgi:hypothetical protein